MIFFELPFCGVGTSDVESLSSYLIRLAEAQEISVNLLLMDAARNMGYEIENYSCFEGFRHVDLVKPTEQTRFVISILQPLVRGAGLRLRNATLLPVHEAVEVDKKSLALHQKWCPKCFEAWVDNDELCYYKLAWSLDRIDCCHIHNVLLIDRCPHCRMRQRKTGHGRRVAFCNNCNKPLWLSPITPISLDHVALSSDLLRLIEAVARYNDGMFPHDAVRGYLNALYYKYWHEKQERKLHRLVERDSWLLIIEGPGRITLATARYVAAKLNVHLDDMFKEAIAMDAELPSCSRLINAPLTKQGRQLANIDRLPEIKAQIERYIKKPSEPPKMLKEMAADCGVPSGFLAHHCSTLTDEVKKIRSDYLNAQRVNDGRAVRTKISECLDSFPQGMTKKKLVKLILDELNVSERLVLRELKSWRLPRVIK